MPITTTTTTIKVTTYYQFLDISHQQQIQRQVIEVDCTKVHQNALQENLDHVVVLLDQLLIY